MHVNSKNTLRAMLGVSLLGAAALADAEPAFDAYLPADPKTVVQGIYASETKPALKIKDGQTVKIDTVNSTELNKDDYLAVLKSGGIATTTPFIKETVAILERAAAGGAHTAQRPRRAPAHGADLRRRRGAGRHARSARDRLAVQSDFAINRTITNMGHPLATDDAGADRARVQAGSRERKVLFGRTSRFPFWPYLGEMGVTPSAEMGSYRGEPSDAPTGGALDCPDLGKGASIYFPVHVPGALFMAGGGKATGANGKVNYFGMEVPLTAYLQFVVHKGQTLRRPCARRTPRTTSRSARRTCWTW